jgi:hypothetical protein
LAHHVEIIRRRDRDARLTVIDEGLANAIAEAFLELPAKTFEFGAHS